jgi:hypothetical protein
MSLLSTVKNCISSSNKLQLVKAKVKNSALLYTSILLYLGHKLSDNVALGSCRTTSLALGRMCRGTYMCVNECALVALLKQGWNAFGLLDPWP